MVELLAEPTQQAMSVLRAPKMTTLSRIPPSDAYESPGFPLRCATSSPKHHWNASELSHAMRHSPTKPPDPETLGLKALLNTKALPPMADSSVVLSRSMRTMLVVRGMGPRAGPKGASETASRAASGPTAPHRSAGRTTGARHGSLVQAPAVGIKHTLRKQHLLRLPTMQFLDAASAVACTSMCNVQMRSASDRRPMGIRCAQEARNINTSQADRLLQKDGAVA